MDMEMVQKHTLNPVSIKDREKISILDVWLGYENTSDGTFSYLEN